MMPWMKRASRSAPPPLPAMMTNSTGFLGFHAAVASEDDATVAAPAASDTAAARAAVLPMCFTSSP